MHSIRRVFAFGGVVALLTMLIASSTLAANGRSDRGKEVRFFEGQKTCMVAAPGIPHCVMTQSNVTLLSGADIAYISRPPILGEPAPGRIESDILLTTAATAGSRQSTANGHCTFYFSTSTGVCNYSGGTRDLARFRAQLVIGPTSIAPNVYSVIGKYWFGGDRDNEQD
jgi:hypothetical protein